MLEDELNKLKLKQDENIKSAHANIISSDKKMYKSELQFILNYYGIDEEIEADTLEKQLEEIKNKYAINYRFVTLNEGWHKNSMLPLLVNQSGKWTAVMSDFAGMCHFFKDSKTAKVSDEFAETVFDKALCFYKGFESQKVSKPYLVKYMLKCVSIKEYIFLLTAMLAVMLFSTVIPNVQYYIFNNIVPSGTKNDIFYVGCLLSGVLLISLGLYVFRGVVTANIPLKVRANLQSAVVARLLKLKSGFFTKQMSGALSNAIIAISDISKIFSGKIITDFVSAVLSVIYAVEIFIYAREFMTYVYLAFVVLIALTLVNTFFINKYNRNFSQRTNKVTGFVYEVFGGMENVKLNNADSVMFNRWSKLYADSLKAQKKPFVVKYYNGIYSFIVSVFMLVIFYVGIGESTSAASFIAFMSLYGLFLTSVGGISPALNAVADFNCAYSQLEEFFNAETEETGHKLAVDAFSGNVEFLNVCFKFPDSNNYVLEDIRFSIKKGQKIGITGKSGCGKSTILRLLLGFEQPEKGSIFIDNLDLKEINLSDFRKKLGVILQSSKLIAGDIYSNITLTYPQATPEEVNKVVELVGLKEDIESMPMGMHTYVSDDNISISGGQKQRILLARAIISKPSLLVLDEATNALDNITQAAITRYIDSTDSTAIIVAHRLSTIRNCDNIIVIDNKHIAEQGNYDELIQKKGVFYSLVKNQIK